METKLRWLQSEQVSAALLKKFAAKMSEHPFTPESSRGFLVTKSRGSSLNARFVEKLTGKRELIDPFGNRLQLPFVTYDIIHFRLSSDFPNLELLNAPKSPKKLLFFLTEITGESFAMSSVEVDVKKWISTISSVFGNLEVSEVNYRDLMVNPNVAADIVFYGTGDVAGDAKDFVGRRAAIVARATLNAQIDNRDASIELSRMGTLKTNIALDSRHIDELRGTFVAATGKK